jgi:exopolysaccharide production protein ExoQ
MPPSLALLLLVVTVIGLLRFDPAKEPGVSAALWVPLIWIFIIASRLPSQWLGGQVGQAAEALEEGNALDRSISLALILLAIGILISRSFRWGDFLAQNFALTTFLAFCLLSVLWSDFPFVAFKRWVRDLGNYFVILVVLSDRRPLDATRTLLRRLFYLLIPLSILLIRYYPELSRGYDIWTGEASYTGAATSKNTLGVMCLVSGLFFVWDTLTRWADRKLRPTGRILVVNAAFIAMTLWLLNMSSSATSSVCLVLGCAVMAATRSKLAKRRPALLKGVIPVGICLYLLITFAFGVDLNAALAEAVGRDPTLTDRTRIWEVLLGMGTDPLIGTGYESFWLGSRLLRVWQSGFGGINEAHNGYLQAYLNLGLIGLFLIALFLASSYRTACRMLEPMSIMGSFTFAVWTVLIFYNITEAAILGGVLWLLLLLGVIKLSPRKRVSKI